MVEYRPLNLFEVIWIVYTVDFMFFCYELYTVRMITVGIEVVFISTVTITYELRLIWYVFFIDRKYTIVITVERIHIWKINVK